MKNARRDMNKRSGPLPYILRVYCNYVIMYYNVPFYLPRQAYMQVGQGPSNIFLPSGNCKFRSFVIIMQDLDLERFGIHARHDRLVGIRAHHCKNPTT